MTIPDLLKMSPKSYEDIYEKLFFMWVENLTKIQTTVLQKANRKVSDNLFQMYLANSAISRYYRHEFDKLEQDFIELMSPSRGGIVGVKSAREIYHSVTAQMFNFYPSALMESAEKLTINSN